MKRLVVFIGAGASHDCSNDQIAQLNEPYRPPLVSGLFRIESPYVYPSILSNYRRAEMLAGTIRNRLMKETLESILLEIRDAGSSSSNWRGFLEIPLYLQELFQATQFGFVSTGANNYELLLTNLYDSQKYDQVLILTTNYDLYLEKAFIDLNYIDKFSSKEDYLNIADKFSLIKLHGSINWGRKLKYEIKPSPEKKPSWQSSMEFLEKDFDGSLSSDPEVFDLPPNRKPKYLREGSRGFYYPYLAVPIAEKNGYACFPEHVEFAEKFLENSAHYWFVGFSGFDTHILEGLLSTVSADSLTIVNGKSGTSVLLGNLKKAKCLQGVILCEKENTWGFSDFIRDQIRGFLS